MTEKKQKQLFEEASSYQFATEQLVLGPWTSYSILTDPKHLGFVLARYKFASKMIREGGLTLEIGCGDGIGAPVLGAASSNYLGIDVDDRLVIDNSRRLAAISNLKFSKIDITEFNETNKYDNVVHIDVLEHLDSELEAPFVKKSISALKNDGVYVCGSPSKYSEAYASPQSALQHINLKTAPAMKALFEPFFNYVWIFSMNDEVVHTGYHPMAHYLFAVCAGKK
jgi:2-polyprenyl-3-methyl-5-hydroxy-6-metoxy-1,4-benzoquinol methylase